MNLDRGLRLAALPLFVAALMSGCASQPVPEPAPAPEPVAPAPKENAAVPRALADADAAIQAAKALDWIWRDTESIYQEAQAAAAAGEDDKAIALANKAREQAEAAVNQYYLEKAKPMLAEAQGYGGLDDAQKARLAKAEDAVAGARGREAYDLLSALIAELRASNIQYDVVRGDSLWKISGKSDIYNNPYEWPLIYKANSDKIKDPDLIYPGQTFSIDRNPSAEDVDAAVKHAKTRGAWSLDAVEQSDQEYLGGSLRIR